MKSLATDRTPFRSQQIQAFVFGAALPAAGLIGNDYVAAPLGFDMLYGSGARLFLPRMEFLYLFGALGIAT